MNESVKSTHTCQRRIRGYLFRALTNSIVEVAPSLPLVMISLARGHQKSEFFRHRFWALFWVKIVHALPEACVDTSQDGATRNAWHRMSVARWVLSPPTDSAVKKFCTSLSAAGKPAGQINRIRSRISQYEPLSHSGRRFTGMTRCFLASLSTIRDFPIPDD